MKLVCATVACLAISGGAFGDGKVVPPRNYTGSLEERAQEAVIVFHSSDKPGEATEDLILKIQVAGDDLKSFAWIVPFPHEPKTAQEDAAIFRELFRYVESRRRRARSKGKAEGAKTASAQDNEPKGVKVLSRKTVGSYDVAVIEEQTAGSLNRWLEENGYRELKGAEDVIEFYRKKQYVFACVKVDDAQLTKGEAVDLHPLRFTFKTGGRDGCYFPMKLTGLQSEPFDVNLYVFHRFWLNDDLNKFGYVHRGFDLVHRDWDTRECEPNGGKAYTNPKADPYLSGYGHMLPETIKLLQKLHPGEKYYLTNLQARGLKPADVREWSDDLWMFPHYTDRAFAPHDVRKGGPAATAWPNLQVTADGRDASHASPGSFWLRGGLALIATALAIGLLAAGWQLWRGRNLSSR